MCWSLFRKSYTVLRKTLIWPQRRKPFHSQEGDHGVLWAYSWVCNSKTGFLRTTLLGLGKPQMCRVYTFCARRGSSSNLHQSEGPQTANRKTPDSLVLNRVTPLSVTIILREPFPPKLFGGEHAPLFKRNEATGARVFPHQEAPFLRSLRKLSTLLAASNSCFTVRPLSPFHTEF